MILHRRIFTFLIIGVTFIFTSCSEKKAPQQSISGTVKNLNENYVILSKVEDIQTKKNTIIDTLIVDESGNFNYIKPLESDIYILTFNSKKAIQLAFAKGQNIIINGNHLDSLTISGSSDTQLLLDYETFRKESLNRLVYSVRKEITALKKGNVAEQEIAELRELEVENYEIHLNELTVFIKENMGTSIAIYPTSIRWNSENLDTYSTIVANFKEAHPTSKIVSKLQIRVDLLQKTAIGSLVSNIEMPSKEGEIISLNSSRKTYTLIDFWASWCPPCRTESSLLNELYTTYQSKGFEIYGISLDSKKQRWLDALEKDQRIWPNISTVEGFKTPVAREYGITALPTNFIIDSEGKIIASNIHGKHLKALVEELFN